MTTNSGKIERYFCNDCGQKTKHFVRSEHSRTEDVDQSVTSFTQRPLTIECCGCEKWGFVKQTHFSEETEYGEHPITGDIVPIPIWDEAIYLNLDPETVDMKRSGVRDVCQIGHFGAGARNYPKLKEGH